MGNYESNGCKDINLHSLKILTEYFHVSMDCLMGFTEKSCRKKWQLSREATGKIYQEIKDFEKSE